MTLFVYSVLTVLHICCSLWILKTASSFLSAAALFLQLQYIAIAIYLLLSWITSDSTVYFCFKLQVCFFFLNQSWWLCISLPWAVHLHLGAFVLYSFWNEWWDVLRQYTQQSSISEEEKREILFFCVCTFSPGVPLDLPYTFKDHRNPELLPNILWACIFKKKITGKYAFFSFSFSFFFPFFFILRCCTSTRFVTETITHSHMGTYFWSQTQNNKTKLIDFPLFWTQTAVETTFSQPAFSVQEKWIMIIVQKVSSGSIDKNQVHSYAYSGSPYLNASVGVANNVVGYNWSNCDEGVPNSLAWIWQ